MSNKECMINPLGDRVVVKALEPITMTASGIIIPDTATKEKPQMGTVVAVGPGAMVEGKRTPVSVSVGDVVLYAKYAPDEIEHNGEEYLIIREDSLLAIVTT